MKKLILMISCLYFVSPALSSPADINLVWFKSFNDDILMNYLYQAQECNHDINVARKNILKYRQNKNLKISNEFPYASVGSDYLLLKVPKLAIPNNDIQTNSFALPFMTIWELDYLGKKYDEIKKARIDVEKSIYELKASSLIVASDLACAYFNAANLNKQIELQEKIIELSNEIHKKRQKMFENGVISATELNNSEDNLIYEVNVLENLKKEKETHMTQIAVLIGKSPYNINDIEVSSFDKINYTGTMPETLNGSIILNRPDIINLEAEMKKTKLDILIAKKDFLPTINIFGILAFSTIVQNFNWQGALAALSAGANQTIFDGGRRIFNLKKRKIEYDIALEKYLNADINALKEVNDALYILKKDAEIYKNQKKRFDIANNNFVNVFKSYKEGVKSLIDYMDENIYFVKKNSELINSKNNQLLDLITLYKAVGGAL